MREQGALLWGDRQRDLNGWVSQTHATLERMSTIGEPRDSTFSM
jgi:hypothetical protein